MFKLLILCYKRKKLWNWYRFNGNGAVIFVAVMGTLISPVGEVCPRTPRLEMQAFHEREFHSLRSVPLDGTDVVRDDFALAIVTGVRVSEVKRIFHSIHGSLFQRRSHQLRVRRSVSFSLQVLNLDFTSSACALKRLRSFFSDSARA